MQAELREAPISLSKTLLNKGCFFLNLDEILLQMNGRKRSHSKCPDHRVRIDAKEKAEPQPALPLENVRRQT
jgi:hypothetical protein